MSQPPSILVVEDERDIADLIAFNLERAGMKPVLVHDGLEAMPAALRESPALVVLDLMLPGKDGLEVFRELHENPHTRSVPVLILTAKAQTEDRIHGLEAGADDYLTKPFSPKELVLRIQAILKRTTPAAAPAELRAGPFHFDKNKLRFRLDGAPVDLTTTEFKLLLHLAERPGTVQSREELLRAVWDYNAHVHTRTLDTHMKRLRQKLGAHAALLETVRGVGYKITGIP